MLRYLVKYLTCDNYSTIRLTSQPYKINKTNFIMIIYSYKTNKEVVL